MKFICRGFVLSVLMLVFWGSSKTLAHPWGGLVIDENGVVYFAFVAPMVGDDHHACVWQINDQGKLTPVLKSSFSPSDIIVSRSPSRMIFGAERRSAGSGYETRLWQISDKGKRLVIGPNSPEKPFHVQAYAVSDNGKVFYAIENQLFRREKDGSVSKVEAKDSFTRIDDLAWGLNDKLYILDRGSVKILEETGVVSVLVEGLKEEKPEDLPFDGANILFDFAVDNQGNVYVAYYGNRRTLKVSPDGEVSVLLYPDGPWSPHGVDVFAGEIYVLESTIGIPRWWEFWKEDIIMPRIRKVNSDGRVSTIYSYESK